MIFKTFSCHPADVSIVLNDYESRCDDLGVVHISEIVPNSNGAYQQYITVVYSEKREDVQ